MSFLKLTTPEGYALDIDGNTRLTFENKSPVLEFTSIPGEKSWPFKLPATPRNKRYLNHPGFIGNLTPQYRRLEGYSLYMGGILYATGSLWIVRADNSYIEVSFQTGAARIARYKDNTLSQFNLGSYSVPALSGVLLEADMDLIASGTIDDFDYTFAPLYNLAIDPTSNSEQVVNRWSHFVGASFGFSILNTDFPITPYFYLHRILEKLELIFGLKHTGSFITDAELRTLVFYSPVTCDNVNFEPARFLPEITIGQLYPALAKLFCMAVMVSRTEDTMRMVFLKDILSSTDYKDISSVTNPNPSLEFFEEKGIQLAFEQDSADSYPYAYASSTVVGEAPFNELTTLFSHPDEYFKLNAAVPPYNTTYKNPIVNQPFEYLSDKPAFSPRLMFYRGKQVNGNGAPNLYPLLSSDNLLWDSSEISGTNYTVNWEGTKGLKNVFWQPYADFITRSKNVIMESRLKLPDVLTFDFARKLVNKSQPFLPYIHKFSADNRGLLPSIIEGYHIQ